MEPVWFEVHEEVCAFARALVKGDSVRGMDIVRYFETPWDFNVEHDAWIAAGRPDLFETEYDHNGHFVQGLSLCRDRFYIEVADKCGVIKERERSTFYETLSLVKQLRQEHPTEAIAVTNIEKSDYDSDGLTDEQREKLTEVL